MNNILEIKNIKKKYHTINGEIEALKDISFNVLKGEFISIVGSSGCGKSTLLHILTNLETKTSGEIIKDEKIKIGIMLQEDALFPWLTVEENILLGLKIKKQINKENKKYANNLIEKYGLKDFKKNYPKELSGGMRQRVA